MIDLPIIDYDHVHGVRFVAVVCQDPKRYQTLPDIIKYNGIRYTKSKLIKNECFYRSDPGNEDTWH